MLYTLRTLWDRLAADTLYLSTFQAVLNNPKGVVRRRYSSEA